ncbi:Hepatic triacylglycerol lipase [Orchesella cincta]|uniref:Hepatic triacylglycerol lipase n=1 Tax=Orchesella cincta TaxID=48709 RepID=A0A1D2M4Y7_ORCCI|nr:Hepatic triacylglycerol lipase [Orchesella cincta]
MVNWTVLADTSNYFAAAQNTRLVSQAAADLIEFLIAENVVKREDIHLVGFSLRNCLKCVSHCPNFSSRASTTLFDVADLHNRKIPQMLIYVNVLHTSGILGFNDPCGTVDWYPILEATTWCGS